MIYIILDKSYEGDGYDFPDNKVIYVSTDKDDAINTFNKYYSKPAKSDKWYYEYELVEYQDGYNDMILNNKKPISLLKAKNY